MNAHEYTDPTGSALTITHDHRGAWITATDGGDEVTVGPFPTRTLTVSLGIDRDLMDGGVTAALVEAEVTGSYTRTNEPGGHDYTPCTHETDSEWYQARWKEAADQREARDAMAQLWKETARALSLHRARSRKNAKFHRARSERFERSMWTAARERDEAQATVKEQAALIEALRADQPRGFTAEDVDADMCSRAKERLADYGYLVEGTVVGVALRTALTPPSARPEGAEELDALVDRSIRGCSDITSPETVRAISNALADEGIRVPGADQ